MASYSRTLSIRYSVVYLFNVVNLHYFNLALYFQTKLKVLIRKGLFKKNYTNHFLPHNLVDFKSDAFSWDIPRLSSTMHKYIYDLNIYKYM